MSSLWGDIENNDIDIKDKNTNSNNQDFSDENNRKFLVNELLNYSIEHNGIDEFCENVSTNLKDISNEKKEKILEIFTKHSKLLDSNNSYLSNPIKGMRLISNIIQPKNRGEKGELEILFDEFDSFVKNDFINFSKKVAIPNEAEIYKKLLDIRDDISENIKFSELASKNHIGVGGSFSAGKSSFLNSILNRNIDDEILPIDSRPTTSIPTYLIKKDGLGQNNLDIYTSNNMGETSKIDKEALLAISHEFDKVYNFGLISIIKKIMVEVNSMPYENIAFLDTPGYSKSDGDEDIDKNIALNHLKNIDSLIWLIDIDNGTIRDGDIKFIQGLNFEGDILFVVNKADKKPLSDIENIVKSIKDILKSRGVNFVDVVAYSSHEKEEYLSKML